MKTIRKVGAVVLALCMCFALCCTAFAADGDDEDEKYTITISNSMAGSTYNAYNGSLTPRNAQSQ